MDISKMEVFEVGQKVEDGAMTLQVINKKNIFSNKAFAYLLTNNKYYYIFSPHLCMRRVTNGFNMEAIEDFALAKKAFENFEG